MIAVTADNAGEWPKVMAGLAAPFPAGCVGWKPARVSGNRAAALAYIDARDVMDRLDTVLGAGNWRDEYTLLPDGSVECRLSVRVGGEWVAKADVGGPSEQPDHGDRMKAAYSDALKRAAVKWGVGRYLYHLESQWVDYDPQKKRFAGTPALPAWAVPGGSGRPAEYGPPPHLAPDPADGPADNPPPDNPPLRARYSQSLAQVKDRAGFDDLLSRYRADINAGRLGKGDKEVLSPMFQELTKRHPKASA